MCETRWSFPTTSLSVCQRTIHAVGMVGYENGFPTSGWLLIYLTFDLLTQTKHWHKAFENSFDRVYHHLLAFCVYISRIVCFFSLSLFHCIRKNSWHNDKKKKKKNKKKGREKLQCPFEWCNITISLKTLIEFNVPAVVFARIKLPAANVRTHL